MTFAGCAFPPAVSEASLCTTIDGARFDPAVVPPGTARVLVFTTTDCPIANSYAPRLVELARQWRDRDVEIVLVHVDPDATAKAARAHANAHELPFLIALDSRHQLCVRYGVTTTPEVAVLARDGIAYQGRIDDRWRARGQDSQTAARHDLRDAVDAVLRGERPKVSRTEPVGCRLPTLP